jgi:hypothetical protein
MKNVWYPKESFRYEWESIWQQFKSDPDCAKKRNVWWQGELAYQELANAGMVQRLLPPEGSPMLRLLLQHVRYFRKLLRDAIPESKKIEESVNTFEKARELFRKHAATVPSLQEWECRMGVEAWLRRQHQQEFGKLPLLPYDRSGWKRPTWIYGNVEWTQDLPVPPIIVERAEKIFSRVRYPQNHTSLVNRHTWLQLRAAVIFKLFLSKPANLTTLTAARLVVLLYGSAGLGMLKDNSNLKIPNLLRPLTVMGLYEKLQRYAVDEVSFSEIPIPEVLRKPDTPICATVKVIYCQNFPAVVQKAATRHPVNPCTCVHVVDEVVVERFYDSRVSVTFSAEYSEYLKTIKPDDYALIALFDGVGLMMMPFATELERTTAKLVAELAIQDNPSNVRGWDFPV